MNDDLSSLADTGEKFDRMQNHHRTVLEEFWSTLQAKLAGQNLSLSHYFAENIIWHLPQTAADQPVSGMQEVMEMFESGVRAFYRPETMRFDIHHILVDGAFGHCHFSLSATTEHGKPYQNAYQALYKFDRQLIAEVWEYFDTAYLHASMEPTS